MQIKSIHFLRMPVTSIFLFHINKKIQCHFDPVRLCGLFWGWGRVRKLFLNLDIQIENFHFLGIALFAFLTLTQLRIIFALLGCISTILDWGRVKQLFWGLLIQGINFHFLSMPLTSISIINQFKGHFVVGVGSENCFGVSIFRLKSFIF